MDLKTDLELLGFRENRTYRAPSGQIYRAVRYRDRVLVWAGPSGARRVWAPAYEEACEVARLVMSGHGSVEFVDAITPVGGTLRYRFNILSLTETNPEGAI